MMYNIFGYFIRREALRQATKVFLLEDGESYTPKLWSLAVFYENYLLGGSEATREDFGPKSPVELTVVPLRPDQDQASTQA